LLIKKTIFEEKLAENEFILHFSPKLFGNLKKKQYLCTRF